MKKVIISLFVLSIAALLVTYLCTIMPFEGKFIPMGLFAAPIFICLYNGRKNIPAILLLLMLSVSMAIILQAGLIGLFWFGFLSHIIVNILIASVLHFLFNGERMVHLLFYASILGFVSYFITINFSSLNGYPAALFTSDAKNYSLSNMAFWWGIFNGITLTGLFKMNNLPST